MDLLLALLLASAQTPAPTQPVDFQLPPGAFVTQNGFTAAIVTTDNVRAFARGLDEGRPQAGVTRTATRGRELTAIILLQNCRAAADGKCNVSGRFTYLLPGGASYGSVDVNDLWQNPAHGDGRVVLAVGPDLVIDPPDPMGEWTLQAEIRDNVRGTTVTVRTPITVATPPTAAAN
jgi:hypothetical protein